MRALDAFLRDAYGERKIVDAGKVPLRLIEDGSFYEPDMQGLDQPVWAGFAGLDVIRDGAGEFRVLEDNLRMPTGIGFAPLAWELVGELLGPAVPEREPADHQAALERFAAILRAAAPGDDGDPSMVVLGDGFENDAQWEISEVAFRMGVPMVTLDDLQRPRRPRLCARRWQAPPGRRRLPALELPPAARGRRPAQRARPQAARADAARHGGGRQPARRRDRRRQARARLRAGDDPLLPRRGAAAGLGRLLRPDRRGRARGRARAAGGDGGQGAPPRRRRGRADRRGGGDRARRHRRAARRTSSPRSSSSSRATRPCATASWPSAGSTCGR